MAKRTRVSFEYQPPPSVVSRPIADLFMRLKPCTILLELLKKDECSISTLYKNCHKMDTMYGYVMTLIHEFRDAGMVETNKCGRTVIIKFTKRGYDIASKIKEINDRLPVKTANYGH